jgi:hypothetical protein|tara:strand:- start:2940 stop:3371 length:432 start_codon:yes stop_codon:yes gene_type:complete
MNFVEVTGGKAKERQLVEEVTCWCVNNMLPRYRTLNIEVNLSNLKDRAMGYCLEGDHNREFRIDIRKGLGLYDLISTVCHEMVHVKQYVKGQLKHRTDGSQMWKTEPDLSQETNYEDTPWELEAFALEEELAKQCFKELNFNF